MLETRRAALGDISALRNLCADSVGEDDYVLRFLERFVGNSVTFVAIEDAQIVGMMVYDDTPDGSVWLHAARTHPDHRMRGVATSLTRACEDLARSRGRTSLRLWAAASNVASVTATQRQGFLERARFTRMRIAGAAPGPRIRLEPLDLERDGAVLAESSILRRTKGYVFHDFYFLPLNAATSRFLSSEGALWRVGSSGVSISGDFEDPGGKDLQVQLLFGDFAEILAAAPSIGRDRGADRVESFLPHDPAILEAAKRAGYEFMEWGQEAVLFEKPLRPPGP